jgi:hypothetical protein
MKSIYQEENQRSKQVRKQVRKQIKELILKELTNGMNPHWFITFHYTDNKTNEDEILRDAADLKNKIRRIAYKNRDQSIKAAGLFPYPRMLFFNEQSHLGARQYHTHMIIERMPATLNTQTGMENLFRKELPAKIRCLSKWKGIDTQRISREDKDLRKLASYLGKQSDLTMIAFDAFNSDLDHKLPNNNH